MSIRTAFDISRAKMRLPPPNVLDFSRRPEFTLLLQFSDHVLDAERERCRRHSEVYMFVRRDGGARLSRSCDGAAAATPHGQPPARGRRPILA